MNGIFKFLSGLNGKILTLAVAPIVLLGIISVIGNSSISSTYDASQKLLADLETAAQKADKLSRAVSAHNVNAQRFGAEILQDHRIGLLTQDVSLADQIRDKRISTRTELASLKSNIEALDNQLRSMQFLPAERADSLNPDADVKFDLATRFAFIQALRLSIVLENQLSDVDFSNDNTLSLMNSGDFAAANANFRFEEGSRFAAFNRRLSDIAAALDVTVVALAQAIIDERTAMITASGDAISSTLLMTLLITLVIIVTIVAVAYLFTSRGIIRPIHAQVGAMNKLADGDMNVDIPVSKDSDLGRIASALESFKRGLVEKADLEAQQKQAEEEERAREEANAKAEQERLEAERAREQEQADLDRARSENMQALIQDFDIRIGNVLASVAEASNALESSANSMRQVAANSDTQSGEASNASKQASTNVSSVAAASEEMAASVQEISRQVARSSEMTRDATTQAEGTNSVVQDLADNVSKIDDVVRMINDIAEQTNLLALNATIEAARAGDAGKGFAVVASEVKALANQTAQATDEIQKQIGVVQDMSSKASGGMSEMLSAFQQTNEIAGSIAAAVEEQNASTLEISQAAGEAANGTDGVASNIEQLRDGVQEARSASEQVFTASETLSAQSSELRSIIEGFLKDIEEVQNA